MTPRLPPPTVWVVCPRCKGTKLDPIQPQYNCEWCAGLGKVSAASPLAKGDPMQPTPVRNPLYTGLVGKRVSWTVAAGPQKGTVETVFYSPGFKADVAHVRQGPTMVEVVNCDTLTIIKPLAERVGEVIDEHLAAIFKTAAAKLVAKMTPKELEELDNGTYALPKSVVLAVAADDPLTRELGAESMVPVVAKLRKIAKRNV